ncbi:MAG: ATP-dependent protease subunit HslV [Candidatus Eisenbacteria bacterium]|nr:ATP-dependent protease subunit HslV [Candidatus Eisenbacteria bacterium]
MNGEARVRHTTILGVRRGAKAAMGGDGQVTVGETVMKQSARKVRKIYKDRVLVGFAGGAADALTLFEKFENKLDEYKGNVERAVVELAKDWRTDRVLRRLEAQLAVVSSDHCFMISGTGDVIEPDDGVVAIGTGGPYALAACRALMKHSDLEPRRLVEESLATAASICVFTNDKLTIEELPAGQSAAGAATEPSDD